MLLLAWLACAPAPAPAPAPVYFVVAARDLNVGVPIGPEDVVMVERQPDLVPPGVFSSPEGVLGRVPSSRILANELVRAERLADPDLQKTLAAMVPPELEVTSFPLAPGGQYVPVPGTDKVDVVQGEQVVLAGLPVFRVDGERVSVVATPEQVRELTELGRTSPLSVVPSAPPPL